MKSGSVVPPEDVEQKNTHPIPGQSISVVISSQDQDKDKDIAVTPPQPIQSTKKSIFSKIFGSSKKEEKSPVPSPSPVPSLMTQVKNHESVPVQENRKNSSFVETKSTIAPISADLHKTSDIDIFAGMSKSNISPNETNIRELPTLKKEIETLPQTSIVHELKDIVYTQRDSIGYNKMVIKLYLLLILLFLLFLLLILSSKI